MTGMIEDFVLRQEGLDDDDLAKVNAALPDIQKLDQVIEKEWPNVNHLQGVLAANWPTINRLITNLAPVVGKIITKQRSLS